MKATIEFNLPEDQTEFDIATNANKYYSALNNFKEYLRNKLKHEEITPEQQSVVENIQSDFLEMLYDQEVIL
jgi:uncharacterized protein YeeX (DUF496 family)